MDELRVGSAFSGIGGIELGLEKAQEFKRVWSCDNDKFANQIYRYHWGDKNHDTSDIRRVNPEKIPKIDILTAGFPCQPFSTQGKRGGFSDPDGTLFFEVCRIAEIKQPELLLLENVKGLSHLHTGRALAKMLVRLEEMGYWWEYRVLDSQYLGPPQSRERIFIIGHLKKSRRYTKPIFFEEIDIENISKTDIQKQGRGQGIFRPVLPTITAGYGTLKYSGEPYIIEDQGGPRLMTPIEIERAQGFPDDWTKYGLTKTGDLIEISKTQRFKKLGNAVNPYATWYIGSRISKCKRIET